jgi:hypothetical protein
MKSIGHDAQERMENTGGGDDVLKQLKFFKIIF